MSNLRSVTLIVPEINAFIQTQLLFATKYILFRALCMNEGYEKRACIARSILPFNPLLLLFNPFLLGLCKRR